MFINFADIFKGFRCQECKHEFAIKDILDPDPDQESGKCPNCSQQLSTHLSNSLFAIIFIYLATTVGLILWAVLNFENEYIVITVAVFAILSYFVRNIIAQNGYITLQAYK